MPFRMTISGKLGPYSRARLMGILSDFGASKITGGKGKELVGGQFRSATRATTCERDILVDRPLKDRELRVEITEV